MVLTKESRKENVKELTADELLEKIEVDKKQLKKSSVFAFAALIAIIVLAIAWFASNNRVSAGISSISAKSLPYYIATKKTETDDNLLSNLKDLLNNKFAAVKGTTLEIENDMYYISNGETIRLQVSADNNLNNEAGNAMEGIAPGTSGKLTFYVIPREKGYKEFSFQMNFAAYKKGENTDSDIQEINNDQIKNLLKGHILFFRNYSEDVGYTDRIENGGKFNITSGDQEFPPEQAIPITIYWVWPEYFQSFMSSGELFKAGSTDIGTFEEDMKEHPEKYFANYAPDKIDSNWNFESLNADHFTYLTECYNTADFQIGSNLDYFYIDFECK